MYVSCLARTCKIQGTVVQNFVSLTSSLRPPHANYISKYTVIFVDKMGESFALMQRILPFFSTKNNSVFVILPFEILTNR